MSGKLTNLFSAQDMTQGSPAANLLRFSVPLLIGNLAQQLYSTVDSIVIGAYVGDGALAAVGASGPILNLLLVLFMGISVGASVMVSQYFGAKDRDRLEATVGTTITATIYGHGAAAPIDGCCIRILAFRGLSACQGSLNSSKIVVNEMVLTCLKCPWIQCFQGIIRFWLDFYNKKSHSVAVFMDPICEKAVEYIGNIFFRYSRTSIFHTQYCKFFFLIKTKADSSSFRCETYRIKHKVLQYTH